MWELSILDYVVFCAVLLTSTMIGVYYAWQSRKVRSEEEKKKYLLGDKGMGVFPVSISLVASFLSTGSVLGIPAEIFAHSVSFVMSFIGGILGIIICRVVFLPVFYDLQLTSVNKYLQKRFNYPALRLFVSISFVLMNMFSSGISIYGPALAISSVTPLPVTTSIMAVGFVCTVYTTLGGMKAVIWTDVVQFTIMTAGLLMVAIQGTITAGGWNKLWETADRGNLLQWANFHVDPVYGVPTFLECVLGMLVGYGGMFSTNQMSVQRFCSFPTKKQAARSLYVSIIVMVAFVTLSCYCGVVLFGNYYGCDPLKTGKIFSPDQLMPYYVMDHLRFAPGLAGLFVATVFSGSLSTISSFINSVTVVMWHDMLKNFVKVSPRTENIILKVIALSFGLITTVLAFLLKGLGTVLEVGLIFFGCVFGPQFGMFLLGALCPFVDGKSGTIGFVVGQIVMVGLNIAVVVLGRPKRRLPTSVEECPAMNFTSLGHGFTAVQSLMLNETANFPYQTNGTTSDVLWIHNISPFFMPFLGSIITIIIGVIATFFTGGMNYDELNVRYISPIVRRFVRKSQDQEKDVFEVGLLDMPTSKENGKIVIKPCDRLMI